MMKMNSQTRFQIDECAGLKKQLVRQLKPWSMPQFLSLLLSALLLAAVLSPSTVAYAQSSRASDEKAVDEVLSALHDAASKAQFDRYFDLYADNAIFLGTDATERWTVDEFKTYAKPSFDQGRGWTYQMKSRHVYVSDDGKTAWFDETLENANLGDTRGSGTLVKQNGKWKFTQYNLTIPIPNDLAREFVGIIRKADARAKH